MLKNDVKLENCTRYKYPHGDVYIGPSDETVSCGFLEIAPDRATPKMTRPLPEHIKQISGNCEIEMFDTDNRITIKKLNPGDTFVIPTGITRVHRNRGTEPSLNYWEYQGNANSLVEQMRTDGILDESFKIQEIQIKPEDCEAYQLPSGKIYIGKSDSKQSIGFIELKSGMALDKHTRPFIEKLKQVKGTARIELFQASNEINITQLSPGMGLTIPAKQPHIHSNNTKETSLTYWQLDGDATSIIAQIRTEGVKV